MPLTWNPALNDLITLLARLYPDRDKARLAVREAGLDPDRIDLMGPPPTFWMRIVEEANRRDGVWTLLGVAREEFPNVDFSAVEQLLRQPTRPRKTVPAPRSGPGCVGQTVRLVGWVALVAAIGVICVVGIIFLGTRSGSENPPLSQEHKNTIGMRFRLIPKGKSWIGSRQGENRHKNDLPWQEVEIPQPFYMGVYEVTVRQFQAFIDDEKSYEKHSQKGGGMGWNAEKRQLEHSNANQYTWKKVGWDAELTAWGHLPLDDHPVVNVSWNDAMAFCEWLSKKEGKTYQLPRDEEWEYACRAGTTKRFSTDKDDVGSLRGVANIADESLADFLGPKNVNSYQSWNDFYPFTAPVSSSKFAPNKWGLYQMHGNVGEWCSTEFGGDRVARGGAWNVGPVDSANRAFYSPITRYYSLGFRVVLRPGTRAP